MSHPLMSHVFSQGTLTPPREQVELAGDPLPTAQKSRASGQFPSQFLFITLYSLLGSFAMVRKGTHNYQISPFFDEFNNIWEWWCDKGKC